MKKVAYLFLSFLLMGVFFYSCDDSETYADLKSAERKSIKNFISEHEINVISESEFNNQDSTTDVSKNEYVYFSDSGVYMQIVQEGTGDKLEDGDWKEVLARFWEIYVDEGDTSSVSNMWENYPDVFMCNYSSGSFTASFTEGNMYSYYGSSVPTGWLIPLLYVRLGRILTDDLAKVKLIVPHTSGHSEASASVYACYYEITYSVAR